MRRIHKAIVALVLVGSPRYAVSSQAPESRMLVLIGDRSKSFSPHLAPCISVVRRAVPSLGPGDVFVSIDVRHRFDATSQARELDMPTPDASMFERPLTMGAFRKQQAALDSVWRETKRLRTQLDVELARATKVDSVGTDLFGALAYASHRLETFAGRRFLVICSDFEQDVGRHRTLGPPTQRYRLPAVAVVGLFVPWRDAQTSERQLVNWRDWFTSAGATSFTAYDQLASANVVLMSPSRVPSRVPSPFAEARP
jgi:hypothetical protein